MVWHPSLCKTCNNYCGPSAGVFATNHAGHCSLAFPVPGKTQVKLQMVSRTLILSLHIRVQRLCRACVALSTMHKRLPEHGHISRKHAMNQPERARPPYSGVLTSNEG